MVDIISLDMLSVLNAVFPVPGLFLGGCVLCSCCHFCLEVVLASSEHLKTLELPADTFTRISNLFGFQSQLTQLAKIEVVRFWIGLIPLFIDWPHQGGRWISGHRTPKWAKNDY